MNKNRKTLARPKNHQNSVARAILARPKNHQKSVARPILARPLLQKMFSGPSL